VTEDLQDRNARLRGKIEQLVDNHPELEAVVNDVALKQPTTASLEKVQANLQGFWCELLGHSIVVGESVERQS